VTMRKITITNAILLTALLTCTGILLLYNPNNVRTEFGVQTNSAGDTTRTSFIHGSGAGSPNISQTDTFERGTGLLTSTGSGNISTNFSYNNRGQLSSIHHSNFATTFDYHGDGRLHRINVPGRTLATFNSTQSQDTITWGNGQVVTHNFDAQDRLISVATSNWFNATIVRSLTDPRNYQINHSTGVVYQTMMMNNGRTFTIQNSDRAITITNTIPAGSNGNVFHTDMRTGNNMADGNMNGTFHFDSRGRLTHMTSAGAFNNIGTELAYTYNGFSQIESRRTTRSMSVPLESRFTYNNHRLSQERFYVNNVLSTRLMYSYHPNGNVSTVWYNDFALAQFEYDQHNRLVSFIDWSNDRRYLYQYDNGGNITSVTAQARQGTTWVTVDVTTYQYTDPWRDLLTNWNGHPIIYDPIGNPLLYRNNMQMTWENGRQLTQIQNANNLRTGRNYGTLTMQYDINGLRTRKHNTATNVATYYYWDGDRLVAFHNRSNVGITWLRYDQQGIAGIRSFGQEFHFSRNMFGDVIAIYDTRGVRHGSYVYCPWGRILQANCYTGSNIVNLNPIRWRGKYYDVETGLYYMQSRFYDPQTGRFISPDDPRMLFALADIPAGGANLFVYALNNPVMFIDPTGYNAVWNFFAGAATNAIGFVTGLPNAVSNVWNDPWGAATGMVQGSAEFHLFMVAPPLWLALQGYRYHQAYQIGGTRAMGEMWGTQLGGAAFAGATMGVGKGAKFATKGLRAPATTAARPMTPKQMARSITRNPSEWRLSGAKFGKAGRGHPKNALSMYANFTHTKTGQMAGFHVITVRGRFFISHQHVRVGFYNLF